MCLYTYINGYCRNFEIARIISPQYIVENSNIIAKTHKSKINLKKIKKNSKKGLTFRPKALIIDNVPRKRKSYEECET